MLDINKAIISLGSTVCYCAYGAVSKDTTPNLLRLGVVVGIGFDTVSIKESNGLTNDRPPTRVIVCEHLSCTTAPSSVGSSEPSTFMVTANCNSVNFTKGERYKAYEVPDDKLVYMVLIDGEYSTTMRNYFHPPVRAQADLTSEDTLRTALTQEEIAEDVAEKCAFESGNVGNYTEQDLANVRQAMAMLPIGAILLGCSDQPYGKCDHDVWDEFELTGY